MRRQRKKCDVHARSAASDFFGLDANSGRFEFTTGNTC